MTRIFALRKVGCAALKPLPGIFRDQLTEIAKSVESTTFTDFVETRQSPARFQAGQTGRTRICIATNDMLPVRLSI